MKNKTFSLFFATFSCISIMKFSPAVANDFILDDAERFAKLFTLTPGFDEKHIKHKYLNIGSKGIEIFTPNRIENEKNLIRAISENSDAYKKGINVCLPAARKIASDAKQVLNDVKTLLAQEKSAPTYILFGANNSGGTASKEGLSLGLEVLCRFSETEEEAKKLILSFVAHEIVHVYQARQPENKSKKYNLLRQALSEGFADFIANLVLGNINQSEIERHNFGVKNESVIWPEFKAVMNGKEFTPWMYGPGGEGRPKDLGYWLGKRIAQAFYEKADDKKKALAELLYLKDPQSILISSGYNPT